MYSSSSLAVLEQYSSGSHLHAGPQVHRPTGTMPSLLLRGGSRFSSHRNCSGKWTRRPRTAPSSSHACWGSRSHSRSLLAFSLSSRMLCTELQGRQQNTWSAGTGRGVWAVRRSCAVAVVTVVWGTVCTLQERHVTATVDSTLG